MIYCKELSKNIIGAAIEVHKVLGNGFLEKVYENALLKELTTRGIKAKSQVPINIEYKGSSVGEYYADIFVEDKIILELKVCKAIEDIHKAQLLNYLKGTGIKVGYLFNFGAEGKLDFKRMVY